MSNLVEQLREYNERMKRSLFAWLICTKKVNCSSQEEMRTEKRGKGEDGKGWDRWDNYNLYNYKIINYNFCGRSKINKVFYS